MYKERNQDISGWSWDGQNADNYNSTKDRGMRNNFSYQISNIKMRTYQTTIIVPNHGERYRASWKSLVSRIQTFSVFRWTVARSLDLLCCSRIYKLLPCWFGIGLWDDFTKSLKIKSDQKCNTCTIFTSLHCLSRMQLRCGTNTGGGG